MSRIIGTRYRRLDDVLAAVPDPGCRGLCAAACTSLTGSRAERQRARQAGADVLDPALAIGQPCPALTAEGQCGIYQARPLICRLYGATEGLDCEHGCEPEGGKLTKREGFWLLGEARRIGGRIAGTRRA